MKSTFLCLLINFKLIDYGKFSSDKFPYLYHNNIHGCVWYEDEYCIWADCRCNYFYRAYNDFGWIFTIDGVGVYFVVRGRKNNDFRPMKWKRRLLAGVLPDAVGYMDRQQTMSKYPEKIKRIINLDSEFARKVVLFDNALDISLLKKWWDCITTGGR